MGLWKLFCAADSKKLVTNDRTTEEFFLPSINDTNQQSIEFVMLTRNPLPSVSSPWSRVSVGSYTLAIGLFLNSNRSQLAFQNAWTADLTQNRYTGQIAFNTGAVSTALGTNLNTLDCTFEIQCTETITGNIFTAYSRGITLNRAFITAASLVTPPTEVAATQAWSNASFVHKDGEVGAVQIWRSSGGNTFLVYFDDDGQLHADKLSGSP